MNSLLQKLGNVGLWRSIFVFCGSPYHYWLGVKSAIWLCTHKFVLRVVLLIWTLAPYYLKVVFAKLSHPCEHLNRCQLFSACTGLCSWNWAQGLDASALNNICYGSNVGTWWRPIVPLWTISCHCHQDYSCDQDTHCQMCLLCTVRARAWKDIQVRWRLWSLL